jgi:heptosyltransferase-2
VPELHSILIIQTAFPGDVILTLPLAQVLQKHFPSATIDMMVTPQSSHLLENHPAIREVVVYDKRGKDSGIQGFFRQVSKAKTKKYDVVFIPHRSFRSAALAAAAGIPQRIGFHTSSGRWLLTNRVQYESESHEVDRNLKLLTALDITAQREIPHLYPSSDDCHVIDEMLSRLHIYSSMKLIGIAPGTMWKTKQWLPERFEELVERCSASGYAVALIGGKGDEDLCRLLLQRNRSGSSHSFAGRLTFLQSAELIRRCHVLVTNDSAPMHLAVAMKTPVVAIFGATVPEFGFAPLGKQNVVVETRPLDCRPCSIHGGDRCPIGTFDCMNNITVDDVFNHVVSILQSTHTEHLR